MTSLEMHFLAGIIDSHAHLGMAGDGAMSWIERARQVRMGGIIAIAGAVRPGELDETLQLARMNPGIAVSVGVHPHEASGYTEAVHERLQRHCEDGVPVAIGEIGLDYHYNHSSPAIQRQVFVRQLRLARAHGLPVVIHTREAEADTLAILRDECDTAKAGVIHCFSGSSALADGALALGFYLSFSGIVTFPRSIEIQQVAASAPADAILVETDAPFLSPVPLRGQKNEPAHSVHTLNRIAALRNVDAAVLAAETAENTRRCFRLSPGWGWQTE